MKKLLLLLILIVLTPLKERSLSKPSRPVVRVPIVIKVKATVYNALPRQTDSTPLITADKSLIDLKKLKSRELRWVALSQDLIKNYTKDAPFSYGDTIIIISPRNKKIFGGRFVVKDCKHERFKMNVDFLQDTTTTKTYLIPDSVLIIKI